MHVLGLQSFSSTNGIKSVPDVFEGVTGISCNSKLDLEERAGKETPESIKIRVHRKVSNI